MASTRKPRKPPPPSPRPQLWAALLPLIEQGCTGMVRVFSHGHDDTQCFLMGGMVVGCSRADDAVRVADYLVSAGAASRQQVGGFATRLSEGEDLVDLLVMEAGVSPEAVNGARRSLFEDNFFGMLVLPDQTIEWEAADMVFPPNLQINVDQAALAQAALAWFGVVSLSIEQLRGASDEWVLGANAPDALESPAFAMLGDPHSMEEILDLLGLPRWRALRLVASLIQADGLVLASSLHRPTLAPTPSVDNDYEKAAQGHFVKSYDVLDKVDLSGAMDSHPQHEVATFGSIEAVEVGGEIDEEDDEHMGFTGDFEQFDEHEEDLNEIAEDDLEDSLADDDLEVSVDSGDSMDAISSHHALLALRVEEDDEEEDAASQVAEGLSSTGELSKVAGKVFSRDDLHAFHGRVDVFNNMFRIMWRTFVRYLGNDGARERFINKVDGSRAGYPELFTGIQVADDGSLRPAALINNLAECPPGDYGATLHQGLYELMFSHIFDAKEFLPPEVEAEMMEQVVVFERQLHSA